MLWAGCWAEGEPAQVSLRREEGRIQSNVGNALPRPQSITHNTLFYAYYFHLIMSVSWKGSLHKLQLQNISTSLFKTRILIEAAKSVRVLAEPHTNLTPHRIVQSKSLVCKTTSSVSNECPVICVSTSFSEWTINPFHLHQNFVKSFQ